MSTTRTGLWRELAWRLEALGLDILSAVARVAPIDAISDVGGALFTRLGPMTSYHQRVVRNLRVAFPDWSEAERERVARAQWDNIGRTLFEFAIIDRIMADKGRVEFVGFHRLEAIASSGRPAVFVSGHFANWETMAAAAVLAGVPTMLTYRAANNPYVDARMKACRMRYGLTRFSPKGPEAGRQIFEAMSQGVSIAILNDQKYDEGVTAPFFGLPVRTHHAGVRFAIRFGAPLLPAFAQRLKGARFRLTFYEPIELEKTGSKAGDVEAGVRQVNEFLEARVRERPSQYWWVHRRFPDAAYAALDHEDFGLNQSKIIKRDRF